MASAAASRSAQSARSTSRRFSPAIRSRAACTSPAVTVPQYSRKLRMGSMRRLAWSFARHSPHTLPNVRMRAGGEILESQCPRILPAKGHHEWNFPEFLPGRAMRLWRTRCQAASPRPAGTRASPQVVPHRHPCPRSASPSLRAAQSRFFFHFMIQYTFRVSRELSFYLFARRFAKCNLFARHDSRNWYEVYCWFLCL